MNTLTAAISYDASALEPVLTSRNVREHLEQHHAAACAEVSAAVQGTDLARLSLESLIQFTPHFPSYRNLLQRACQIRNHNFYWQSLQPGGGRAPWGPVSERIQGEFGTLGSFIESAQTQAASLIGSGWLWVVWRGDKLAIKTTENMTTYPLGSGTVLLALDLWEHAYYPDFRSHRSDYVAACFEKLINWDFANARLRDAWMTRKRLRQRVDPSDAGKSRSEGLRSGTAAADAASA